MVRLYEAGRWGLRHMWGVRGSSFQRALAVALPNAAIAYALSTLLFNEPSKEDLTTAGDASSLLAAFTSVLFFILYFRSNMAYGRWWESVTLLRNIRAEWWNSYSSMVAFTTTDPKRADEVRAFHHMITRLFSLLMGSALQQLFPDRNRAFEMFDTHGLDHESIDFMRAAPDKTEVVMQWISRNAVINMGTGILPIPPPVMARCFQELSRGFTNLSNVRKIADFPFPFPHAQISVVMLLIHWVLCPIFTSIRLEAHLAAFTCFVIIFFLWSIHFTALQMESPFTPGDNDLPLDDIQGDWNKSVALLLARQAHQPPAFAFDPAEHFQLRMCLTDGRPIPKKRKETVRKFYSDVSKRLRAQNDLDMAKRKAQQPGAAAPGQPVPGAAPGAGGQPAGCQQVACDSVLPLGDRSGSGKGPHSTPSPMFGPGEEDQRGAGGRPARAEQRPRRGSRSLGPAAVNAGLSALGCFGLSSPRKSGRSRSEDELDLRNE